MPHSAKFGSSERAIQAHYDLSNEFYKLWLDDAMVYSGAMFLSESDSLEHAQINKLDHHIRASGADTARSVLDIGCGWGAALSRVVATCGAERITGLTLSNAQADYIAELGLGGCEVRVENWQDHYPLEPYDSIISIGAFEHFAKLDDSQTQKLESYRAFFKHCQDALLVPGGYMSVQTFAYGSRKPRQEMVGTRATAFLSKEIFQETDPPHLLDIVQAVQGHFEIVELRNDRSDYVNTLREWISRLDTHRERAIELVGLDQVETYERYLKYSILGFQSGNLDLYRIKLKCLDKPWTSTR